MANPLAIFTNHPKSVNETYVEHMHISSSFGFLLLLAAFCALVHAILPFAFEKTASGIINKLYARMVTNRVVKPAPVDAPVDTAEGAQA